MKLSYNIIKNRIDMPLLDFPDDMYSLRTGEEPLYGEYSDLKKAVQWFISLISEQDWHRRRDTIAKHFYKILIREIDDPTGKGRYFAEEDQVAWYLFLGEAFNDHPWNYEVSFGCRIVPVLGAIGRNLEILKNIKGFTERATRIVTTDKGQPNGGLFEVLVAAAYAREGWEVTFKPEQPGKKKTHDLDIRKDGIAYAVECKRMEGGEYVEQERAIMRSLWHRPCDYLIKKERNTIFDVNFKIELSEVPPNYLYYKAQEYIASKKPTLTWVDPISTGEVKDLDLTPVQESLKINPMLYQSPIYRKMLTGKYLRYDSIILAQKVKYTPNPQLIEKLDAAVALRWKNSSEQAIYKKARDILRKLAEANNQLPSNTSGAIHIGFETLSGDEVEQRRYEKILSTVESFDSGTSGLEYVYCHYFSPESSPEKVWAFDETTQWVGIQGTDKPLKDGPLVLPHGTDTRKEGTHWSDEA